MIDIMMGTTPMIFYWGQDRREPGIPVAFLPAVLHSMAMNTRCGMPVGPAPHLRGLALQLAQMV
jgi:hypothetical protein